MCVNEKERERDLESVDCSLGTVDCNTDFNYLEVLNIHLCVNLCLVVSVLSVTAFIDFHTSLYSLHV